MYPIRIIHEITKYPELMQFWGSQLKMGKYSKYIPYINILVTDPPPPEFV